MDTLTYSKELANQIAQCISKSGYTKQQVSIGAGIPWATFCRRIDHPEKSFFTIVEVIAICDYLKLDFIDVLSAAESALAGKDNQ